MSDDTILVRRHSDATAIVTINRPDKKNALTVAMWDRIAAAFERLGEEPALRAILLTGADGVFCAGADIAEFSDAGSGVTAEVSAARFERTVELIEQSPKATFAAVSGPAFGGGCGLALACDFRVGDRSSAFAIPAARLGLVYGITPTRSLYQTVGLTAAKDILFTGRRIGAEEALALGLLGEISDGDALDRAISAAETLERSAPLSIAGAKLALSAVSRSEPADKVAAVAAMMTRAVASRDHKEGAAAFREKRPPAFKGS